MLTFFIIPSFASLPPKKRPAAPNLLQACDSGLLAKVLEEFQPQEVNNGGAVVVRPHASWLADEVIRDRLRREVCCFHKKEEVVGEYFKCDFLPASTSWNMSMELENHLFEKENHLPNLRFRVPC